ncbi:MAG: NUDIX domain-containing protein [bacterium]|nr:NUDIX domain-containing protein [bacterium]
MTEPKKPQAKITDRKSLYSGFFKLEELTIDMDKHDGTSETVKRIHFERGHAVGILAYDAQRDEVLMVNEMRPGMLAAGDYPFNDSLPAGMIDKGETHVDAAVRETDEETGQTLIEPITIHAGAYVSAGGTSEKIALVVGKVDLSKAGGVHGKEGEGENIKTVILSSDEFIERANDGRIKDMKSLVSAFWLANHRDELRDPNATTNAKPNDDAKITDVFAPKKQPTPPQAEIKSREMLYDGVFKIEQLTVEQDKHDGGKQTLKRLNFERGDAIAILGYDPKRDEVVLVNEMRTGMLAAGDYPYADTVPAAMLKKGEDLLTAAADRLARETGLALQNGSIIHSGAYVSAGGSTEKIALVTGIVDSSNAGGVRGRAGVGEDIKTVVISSDEFIARAEDGRLTDMKSLAMAFWLAKNRDSIKAKANAPEPKKPPASLSNKIAGLG